MKAANVSLEEQTMILPRDKKESFYEFYDVRKEVVFHRHDMPSPWMNYLNNDEFYTMISQAGGNARIIPLYQR